MKLSYYARKVGVSYYTARRWFHAGQISGYQAPSGTIIVTEGVEPEVQVGATFPQQVVVYGRVSAAENKANLESQIQRLLDASRVRPEAIKSAISSKKLAPGSTTAGPSF